MHRTPITLAALLVAASLTFAACGGEESSSSDDVVSAADVEGAPVGSTDDGSGEEAAASASEDEAILDWTQCMRDNGVDIADPTVDADGNVQLEPPTDGSFDPQSDDFVQAQTACEDLLEGVTFGGAADFDAIQDTFVDFADCLRDEGLDVGDPSFDGPPADGQGGPPAGDPGDGLTAELLEGLVPGLDAGDPATQPAIDSCESILVDGFDAAGIGG
jgi:hypothetical protein